MSASGVQMPGDYNTWKSMITTDCGESLTAEFLDERIKALKNTADPYTKKFREIYGEDYYKAVLSWYERAKTDLA